MASGEDEEALSPVETRAKKKKKNVKKVEAEWKDDVIYKLISAVEERPVLWNAGVSEYKLPKSDAWREVAEALDGKYDWEECKAKWGNLRISFKTNLAKARKTKSGQGTAELNTVHWRFFRAMYFIESADAEQSTPSTSNLNIVSVRFLRHSNNVLFSFFDLFFSTVNAVDVVRL